MQTQTKEFKDKTQNLLAISHMHVNLTSLSNLWLRFFQISLLTVAIIWPENNRESPLSG
jgi:hypothetical protein